MSLLGSGRIEKETVSRLLNRFYFTGKLLYHMKLDREVRASKPVLLVYQMGKVGSSSVVKSLNADNIKAYNVHTFNPFYLKRTERIFQSLFRPNGPIPKTLWDQQFFYRLIRKRKPDESIYIITLVRDPVARNISHFFQYPNMIIERVNGGYRFQSQRYKYDKRVSENDVRQVLSQLFYEKMDNHEQPLTWLDEELKLNFGIDVYSKEFQKARGYATYENGEVKVLLMKLEQLNEVFSMAMKDFMNVEINQLKNENIGKNKASGSLYKKFLECIKLPSDYLDVFYESRLVRHFYSAQEVLQFRKQWGDARKADA